MQGCGGNCACNAEYSETKQCALPAEGVTFDKDGKCPCGKSKENCCHSEVVDENNPLHELCEPHNGKHVCDVNSDLQKTAP